MGTNLSQVFISNTANIQAPSGTGADAFTDLSLAEIGIWSLKELANADNWISTKLYAKTVAESDTAGAVAGTAIANPLWLYNQIQIAQGTGSGTNPIATPLINTANIRRIKFSPFQAFVGTKATIATATLNVATAANNDEYNFKFIIKSTPTDYLNFYDQNAANLFTKEFPLGAFNTTNHKAINVTVKIPVVADADDASNLTKIQDALAAHPILGDMFTAADSGDDVVITARHPGVVFDLLIENVTRAKDPVACAIVGQVLGVGNGWQVLGEEIRCRSRYGNFNRMYLPQNMPTYTNTTYQYHKVTVEYEHNWPTSTGIAPAGTLNQVTLYLADSATAMVAGDTNFDAVFNLADVDNRQEFIW